MDRILFPFFFSLRPIDGEGVSQQPWPIWSLASLSPRAGRLWVPVTATGFLVSGRHSVVMAATVLGGLFPAEGRW